MPAIAGNAACTLPVTLPIDHLPINTQPMTRFASLALALLTCARLSALDIVVNVQHATCGSTTGSIWAFAMNGTPPYTYLWNTGATTAGIFNVPPGPYTLTVTDSQGAEADTTVELLQITDLFPAFTPSQPVWACGSDCTAGFYHHIPLNGVFPFTVTFDPPGPTGGASPNGLYFNNLCPGESYMVTVSDANGCTGSVGPIEVIGNMAPVLLSSSVTGSCPGGATGSFTVEFNVLDTVLVVGPNGYLYTPTTNPLTMGNLPPGDHTITAYHVQAASNYPPGSQGTTSCSTQITVTVPVSTDPCGSISGTVYADLSGDCVQDGDEPGLPHRVLTVQPGDHHILTNATGQYATELFYGSYALDAAIPGYSPICPALPDPFDLSALAPTATINPAMDPLSGPDVSAFLNAGTHRPGFAVNYTVQARNEGPYTIAGTVLELVFDPLLVLVDAPGSPTLLGPGHLQWSLGSLAPFSTQQFVVEFMVPANPALTGIVVDGTATVIPADPDADPSNDSYAISRTIVNAYDPNDKLVQTSSRLNESLYFIDADTWVDFTVRFQNTGTAEAINVHLLDTIAPEFDLTSLQVLGASHAFEASLLPGRVLRFGFPNIMLPDSTTDLAGSQGFASFRLRPVGGLPIGTVLSNAAYIYFDFNDPIRTNDAVLTIDITVGAAEAPTKGLRLHPNPVDGMLWIDVPGGDWTFEAIAMDGRTVLTSRSSGMRPVLDVSGLSPGTYVLRAIGTQGEAQHTRFVKR